MLVLKERVINVPIMSLQTGTQIARTGQPIIDPRELTIVAFFCEGPTLDQHPSVLHVDDIRETGSLGFIVNHQGNLMSPDDLVRLRHVLNFNFTLDDKQVVEQNGRKIGKVVNYTIDTTSFYITQLHVQPNFWQSFSTAAILIGRQQIIQISDKHIVVASATVRSKPTKAAARVADNPFRRNQPQPEVSHGASD